MQFPAQLKPTKERHRTELGLKAPCGWEYALFARHFRVHMPMHNEASVATTQIVAACHLGRDDIVPYRVLHSEDCLRFVSAPGGGEGS